MYIYASREKPIQAFNNRFAQNNNNNNNESNAPCRWNGEISNVFFDCFQFNCVYVCIDCPRSVPLVLLLRPKYSKRRLAAVRLRWPPNIKKVLRLWLASIEFAICRNLLVEFLTFISCSAYVCDRVIEKCKVPFRTGTLRTPQTVTAAQHITLNLFVYKWWTYAANDEQLKKSPWPTKRSAYLPFDLVFEVDASHVCFSGANSINWMKFI